MSSYGQTLTRLARYEEAEHLLLEAHQILSAARGDDDKYTVEAARALADLYDSWHEADPEAGHDSKTARWRAEEPRNEENLERRTWTPTLHLTLATESACSWGNPIPQIVSIRRRHEWVSKFSVPPSGAILAILTTPS